MEGKNSVIIYADWITTVARMPDEDAGKLLKLILEYINDKEPDEEKHGLLVSVAFGPIKQQMKRDLVKWKKTVEQRSDAGKASAEAKRLRKLEETNETQRTSTPVDSVQRTSTKSTVSVNVNEKYIKRLCEVFGISELNNIHSFKSAHYFLERITNLHQEDYFIKQLEAYDKITKTEGWKHSFKKFIGDSKLNYEDGEWCAKTYEPTQEKKSQSTAAKILGKEPIKC